MAASDGGEVSLFGARPRGMYGDVVASETREMPSARVRLTSVATMSAVRLGYETLLPRAAEGGAPEGGVAVRRLAVDVAAQQASMDETLLECGVVVACTGECNRWCNDACPGRVEFDERLADAQRRDGVVDGTILCRGG